MNYVAEVGLPALREELQPEAHPLDVRALRQAAAERKDPLLAREAAGRRVPTAQEAEAQIPLRAAVMTESRRFLTAETQKIQNAGNPLRPITFGLPLQA